jgi:hypothetical protein
MEGTDVSEVRTAFIISTMMETVRTSETSVHSNDTTRSYIPEDSKLHRKKMLHIILLKCSKSRQWRE